MFASSAIVGFGSYNDWRVTSAMLPPQRGIRIEVQKSRKRSKAPKRTACHNDIASYLFWLAIWSRDVERREVLMDRALHMPTNRQRTRAMLRSARMYASV